MSLMDMVNKSKCKKAFEKTINMMGPFHDKFVEISLHGDEETFKQYFEMLDKEHVEYIKEVKGDIIFVKARRKRKDGK